LFALLPCLAFIVFFAIAFNPSAAYADVTSSVTAVPLNGGRVDSGMGGQYDSATSVVVTSRYQDALIQQVRFGSGLGNSVVALSITQIGSHDSFGVKPSEAPGYYPYSHFLQYDKNSSTFYFRCLSNSACTTSYVASLQHDANYVLAAFAIPADKIDDLKAYISRCQDWLNIIANNVTNVNNSIDTLLKSIQQWAQIINNNLLNENSKTFENGKILKSLDEKMTKLLTERDNDKKERDNAKHKSDETRKNLDSTKDKHKPNTEKLSSLVSSLASAQPSSCRIDMRTQGLHIPFDMCDSELPSFVTVLIALVTSVSAIYVTISVARTALRFFQIVNKE
jgi:hypothetical protein